MPDVDKCNFPLQLCYGHVKSHQLQTCERTWNCIIYIYTLYPFEYTQTHLNFWKKLLVLFWLATFQIHSITDLPFLPFQIHPIVLFIFSNFTVKITCRMYTLTPPPTVEDLWMSSWQQLPGEGSWSGPSVYILPAPFETAMCTLLLSSGMIRVEQIHHSTLDLDPGPAAMCKTLWSNTRASYDPQLGNVSKKKERKKKEPHPVGIQLWWNEFVLYFSVTLMY